MAYCVMIDDLERFERMVRIIAHRHEVPFTTLEEAMEAIMVAGYGVTFTAGHLSCRGATVVRQLLRPQWRAIQGPEPGDLRVVPVEAETPRAG